MASMLFFPKGYCRPCFLHHSGHWSGGMPYPIKSPLQSGCLLSLVLIAMVYVVSLGVKTDADFSQMSVSHDNNSLSKRVMDLENTVMTLQRRFWLEDLDPIFHYRPKFWLGKTEDIEDKDQVIPYFLANFVDPASYPRRIYIDLGIKDFESSLCWIMQHYPAKFDRIYGFECATDFRDVKRLETNVQRCIKGTAAEGFGYRDVAETLDAMSLYYNYVGLDDNPGTSPPTKGLSEFLTEAGIQEEDFVVMKMDVEGVEFDLIERMLADGSHKLIDELFVEVHYKHPEMTAGGWYSVFSRSRSEAQALFTKARDAGMFVHPWP